MVCISLLACLSFLPLLIAVHCLCQQARTVPLLSSSSSLCIFALTNKLMSKCKVCFLRTMCTILLPFPLPQAYLLHCGSASHNIVFFSKRCFQCFHMRWAMLWCTYAWNVAHACGRRVAGVLQTLICERATSLVFCTHLCMGTPTTCTSSSTLNNPPVLTTLAPTSLRSTCV